MKPSKVKYICNIIKVLDSRKVTSGSITLLVKILTFMKKRGNHFTLRHFMFKITNIILR